MKSIDEQARYVARMIRKLVEELAPETPPQSKAEMQRHSLLAVLVSAALLRVVDRISAHHGVLLPQRQHAYEEGLKIGDKLWFTEVEPIIKGDVKATAVAKLKMLFERFVTGQPIDGAIEALLHNENEEQTIARTFNVAIEEAQEMIASPDGNPTGDDQCGCKICRGRRTASVRAKRSGSKPLPFLMPEPKGTH